MKDILKNKRIMFPIIVSLAVIIIAILVFIIIGMGGNGNERVSTINLENSSNSGSSVTNVTNTTDDDDDNNTASNNSKRNSTNNTTEDDDDDEEEEIAFGGEDFYLDTAREFVAGLMNENDMADFINNHMDIKAYIASYNVNGDDALFMDTYMSLPDDEESSEIVVEKFKEIVTNDELKLTALTDPVQSSDSDEITRITLTVKSDSGTERIKMVFYQDIVIYIYDSNGDSIVDL